MDIFVVNMIPKSLSGETNQDSEPSVAVDLANPLHIAATAFTPDPLSGPLAPIYASSDGGHSWELNLIIPGAGTNPVVGSYFPTNDVTLRFGWTSNILYAGILRADTFEQLNILRTTNYLSATPMTILESRPSDDQPYVQAATVPSGPGAGNDRFYVGSSDHALSNIPAVADVSLNAATPSPVITRFVLEHRTVSRDGFQCRPAIHANGTIYAGFYSLIGGPTSCDVVIVRDDNWASGASPFTALIDPGDSKPGLRIVTGVNNPFLGLNIGQQRIGGDLSVAVDPRNSAKVYVCWGDLQGSTYTLHVRKSTDSGATWSAADLRTISNATNPALAINSEGKLGFLYQQVAGPSSAQRWETTIEITSSDFASFGTHLLANTPAATPASTFQPYLGDYLYMMAAGRDFYGIFCANNTPDKANFPNGVVYQRNANFATQTLLAVDDVTPVPVSIDPFFFKVTAEPPRVTTSIANSGSFGDVCLGSFADELLTINNSGSGPLFISNIVSSSPDFLAPEVVSYPLKVRAGDSVDVVIRFQPSSFGPKSGTITIFSNAPASPHKVNVSGTAQAPRLSLVIANKGSFGKACVGCFADEPLILSNSGRCALTVIAITSSSSEFLVPEVLSYPLTISAGDSLPVPVRFEPASFGLKSATITVTSNDPASPSIVNVSGNAPSGKLAVTGSTCFGGVNAGCCADRTISICNVGDCNLYVTGVRFKRKSHHWSLLHNPFPATLHPGSCLGVVVRYKATEKCPKSCELVIESDDPFTPIKVLDVLAYTIWDGCGCKENCEDCRKGCCQKHKECCQQGYPCCCDDDDGGENGEESGPA
jgi:hypothetical protein